MKHHETFSRAIRRAQRALPPALFGWMAGIFFAAMVLVGSIPGKAEAASAAVPDKLLHFVAYSVLTLLVYGALRGGPTMRALLTFAAIAILGLVDEGVQLLLSYRTGSWLDLQVDLLAAAFTTSVLTLLKPAQTEPASGCPHYTTDKHGK